jgi:hypothetical protein
MHIQCVRRTPNVFDLIQQIEIIIILADGKLSYHLMLSEYVKALIEELPLRNLNSLSFPVCSFHAYLADGSAYVHA